MAFTAHADCNHPNTVRDRDTCHQIHALVAGFTALTDEELSEAMRAGTLVTGWRVYNTPRGVVLREITGALEYVQTLDSGQKLWTVSFAIDSTGNSCSPALQSAGMYLTGRIRLAG